MYDNFIIYSHPIVSIPAADSRNVDFLVTERPFRVENRVFTSAYKKQISEGVFATVPFAQGDLICNEAEGGAGSATWLLQTAGGDATCWLPPYQSSERIRDIYELNQGNRITFSYDNRTANQIYNVQASWIGYKIGTERPSGKVLRPAKYYLPVSTVAPGDTVIRQITIIGDMSLLVRAFMVTPVQANSLAVSIRNLATGYLYTNVPTLIENFTYMPGNNQLWGIGAAISANFRPLGFSPFIIPNRSTLQFEFQNIGFDTQTFQFCLWGSNYSPIY